MKALTWRGETQSLFDYKIFPAHSIEGAKPGDLIVSAFEIEGKYYASWSNKGIAANGSGIGYALGDSGLTVKTGFIKGETIHYFIYRDGVYYTLKIFEGVVTPKGETHWTGEVVMTPVEVFDNPYYSLPVTWPEIDYTIVLPGKPSTLFSERHLYKYIPFINYLPKFYESVALSLVKGSGKFKAAKNISMSTYQPSKADIERGDVVFRITAKPLKNAAARPEGLSKDIILKW
jgi:hypothetical protein